MPITPAPNPFNPRTSRNPKEPAATQIVKSLGHSLGNSNFAEVLFG